MALRATSEDEKEDKNSLTEEWVTRDDRSEREMAVLIWWTNPVSKVVWPA
jgi:hypothetical protein